MWHGEPSTHIALAFELGGSLQIPALVGTAVDSVKPFPFYTTCLDGSGGGDATNGPGYPYCYFDAMQWPQARSDLSTILAHDSNPLPDDELVLHVRSGDVLLAINAWLTADATSDTYDEKLPNLHAFNLQPGCGFHLDAALRGYDGKPFRKVHLMADAKCAGSSLSQMNIKKGTGYSSGNCASTNPCIAELIEKLEPGVLVLAPPDMSAAQVFQRDVSLMARARNLAVTCSTFSILGRLGSRHAKRLFVPNCNMEYQQSEEQRVHGRRREMSRLSRPHKTWAFLTDGKEGGHAFSTKEHRVIISAYDFLWQGSSILSAAFGSHVFTMDEWVNLTDSVRANPVPKLLQDVAFTKTIHTLTRYS